MATYKEIKGATVQTRSEDPTVNAGTWSSSGNFPGPFYLTGASGGTSTAGWTAAGQLSGSYINESYEFNGATWGSAVSMNRNTSGYAGGNGPQTAGIVVSGYQSAPSGADIQSCETYNGSSWTSIEDLPAVRIENTTGGTSAAALAAAGAVPSATSEYYTYNGSTWTDSGNINTARNVPNAGNGSSTSMLVISGNEPTNTNVESWNGSSWTEIAEVNVGRYRGQAAGADNTSTIWFGGSSNPGAAFANTEQWDGTSWTEVGDMATSRKWPGGNGTSSAAWVTGGDSGPGSNNLASTETWLIPSGPHLNEGDIFLSGGTTLKGFGKAAGIPAATWASGADTNTARAYGGGYADHAPQTEAFIYGGSVAGAGPQLAQSENYNGTAWTEVNDLNTARGERGAGAGTYASAFLAGGQVQGEPAPADEHEQWNGSSWSEATEQNTDRRDYHGNGPSGDSGMIVAGYDGSGVVANTEIWNGSSWTEGADVNTARYANGSIGSTTASICATGRTTGYVANNETWDGASWTEANDVNEARQAYTMSGFTSTLGFVSGGYDGTYISNVELWNGTSWTEINNLATARTGGSGGGSAAAGIIATGNPPSSPNSQTTEEFTAPLANKTITAS